MAKSYVLPALCALPGVLGGSGSGAVFAVASAQFLSDAKQIQSKLEARLCGRALVSWLIRSPAAVEVSLSQRPCRRHVRARSVLRRQLERGGSNVAA